MNKKIKSVTLVELLISVTVVSIMILSFYSIETFSHNQVINSDRRAKVQNELSYAVEHMSKYVLQGIGNNSTVNNRAIQTWGTGFQVRVDFNNSQTPSVLSDDGWIRYVRSGNNLNVTCVGTCGSFAATTLSSKVMTFTPLPGDNGTSVNIYLVGRYNPSQAISLRNPQVEVRTKLICSSCSIN